MMDGIATGWILERPTGTVAERHGQVGLITARSVLVHEIDRPTLVLGSAQRDVCVRARYQCLSLYR